MAKATFAAGCFWGVESAFREVDGVTETAVGYTGGSTTRPSYEQVCSGRTGHAEAVVVEFDPERVGYEELLEVFWDSHDPTQMNRQGPDVGTQYRSAIFVHDDDQEKAALASRDRLVDAARFDKPIVTEIVRAGDFWRAEDYHQQYFEKRGIRSCRF
ncbi:MAG TPA: peptide-methionine (S)-S-oxide reductase MsrA [Actinomycetota bacterium]|nr:peptide-methionine (S)-S-oxide reductase MsrA [Actinomycetota bacterium]